MGICVEKTVFEYLFNCGVESLFCETLSIVSVTGTDIFYFFSRQDLQN
jgi:hypothetical protein